MTEPNYIIWNLNKMEYIKDALKEHLEFKTKRTGKNHLFLKYIIKELEYNLSFTRNEGNKENEI